MLSLEGVLDISVNGIEARFEADDDGIRLDLDNPVAFLRASQLFHTNNLGALRLLAEHLTKSGLTLSIVSRRKTLVMVGHKVKGGVISSAIGIPHLEVLAAGLLGRITA